jgi:hypothetical protein
MQQTKMKIPWVRMVLATMTPLLTLLACADPKLRVTFDIPERFRSEVQQTQLQIFEPSAGDSFGCDALAFGEVSADRLQGSLVYEATLEEENDASLSGINRRARNVLLAQGLDSNGQAIVKGCAEVGDFSSDVSLTLQGEPAAQIQTSPDNKLLNADGVPQEISLRATDCFDLPLDGIEARWVVMGGKGETFSNSLTADPDGNIQFTPSPFPALPGPVSLKISVRWQRAPVPILRGFQTLQTLSAAAWPSGERGMLTPPDFVVGRIGPNGEMGFSGILDPSGASTTIEVGFAYLSMPNRELNIQTIPLDEDPNGPMEMYLLGIASFDDRDVLLVLSPGNWRVLVPGSQTSTWEEHPFSDQLPTSLLPYGNCPASASEGLILAISPGSSTVYTSKGEVPLSQPNLDPDLLLKNIIASGCVGDRNGVEHRILVYTLEEAGPGEIFTGNGAFDVAVDGRAAFRWDSDLVQIGFSRKRGTNLASLVAVERGLDNMEIVRLQLGPLSQTNWSEVDRVALFTSPVSFGTGDLDGDGTLDIVTLLQFHLFGIIPFDPYILHTILGIDFQGKRLAGELELKGTPKLYVEDFDGNGADDILVISPEECIELCQNNTLIDLYWMGSP